MRNESFVRLFVICVLGIASAVASADEPKQGAVHLAELGNGVGLVSLETIYIPPGEFLMGSTPEEKSWATGIEGGAQAGTERESYEGEQRDACE